MKAKYFLIIFALLTHISFYLSATKYHIYEYFFSWGNVHEQQGMDFYQVPNGAYSYLRGGEFTGTIKTYPAYSFGNINVYHPFFTFVIGTPFQMLSPEASINVWFGVRLLIMLLLSGVLFTKFRTHPNLPLGLFVFLASFPHALEIWNGQYHFLLDAGVVLFLLFEIPRALTLSLWVKPIAILWIPALMLHKKITAVIISYGTFLFTTIPFLLNGTGMYYVNNLLDRIQNPLGGPPGVFTLDALFRFWSIPLYNPMMTKLIIGLVLIVLQLRRKWNIFTSVFLWTCFYLLFYDFVFEYHYTTLAALITVGLLTQKYLFKNDSEGNLSVDCFADSFFPDAFFPDRGERSSCSWVGMGNPCPFPNHSHSFAQYSNYFFLRSYLKETDSTLI